MIQPETLTGLDLLIAGARYHAIGFITQEYREALVELVAYYRAGQSVKPDAAADNQKPDAIKGQP